MIPAPHVIFFKRDIFQSFPLPCLVVGRDIIGTASFKQYFDW